MLGFGEKGPAGKVRLSAAVGLALDCWGRGRPVVPKASGSSRASRVAFDISGVSPEDSSREPVKHTRGKNWTKQQSHKPKFTL
jgi:hypothetical protein